MRNNLQDSSHLDKGPKDCRTCMLRRIRCDRSLPRCHKCTKHKKTCPGYGLHIRWANDTTQQNKRTLRSSNVAPSTSDSSSNALEGLWDKAAELLFGLIPNAPDKSEIAAMIKYYNDNIAGKMVWLDSDHNPYRRLVIPLSRSQPILLLAILVVSNEHKAISQGLSSESAGRSHDVVIEGITRQLQKLTDGVPQSGSMDIKTAEWILASILILSNYECVRFTSNTWRLHRHGARTLINTFSSPGGASSELFRFLRHQFSIIDVLASTTTHLYMSSEDVVLPESGSDKMFCEYLRLLHQVDMGSRQLLESKSSTTSPEVFRMKFEMARGSTLLDAGKNYPLTETSGNELIFLADVYHLAGLLYSYRLSAGLTSSHTDVISTSSILFERFNLFKAWPNCAHNLPWPILIAGVESYQDVERQQIISDMLGTVIAETGFNTCGMIAKFLDTFWSGNEPNWLKVMEMWEAQGNYLFAV